MNDRLIKYILMAFLAVGILFSIAPIILSYLPVSTIHYTHLPFPVEKRVYHPGDLVPIHIAYCKDTALGETITGQLFGDNTYAMGSKPRNNPKGCHTFTSRIWEIPFDVLPGKYKMQFTATYTINSYRTEAVPSETEVFQVD